MITSCKNWGIQGNSAKSTNNPMSTFGLSEENMELLSPIIKLYEADESFRIFSKKSCQISAATPHIHKSGNGNGHAGTRC